MRFADALAAACLMSSAAHAQTTTTPTSHSSKVLNGAGKGEAQKDEPDRPELERRHEFAEKQGDAAAAVASLARTDGTRLPQQESSGASDAQRREIGQMLRKRDCTRAIDEALTLGDIRLAADVKAFCGASPAKPMTSANKTISARQRLVRQPGSETQVHRDQPTPRRPAPPRKSAGQRTTGTASRHHQ